MKKDITALGCDVGIFSNAFIVCRPTRKEAEEYHDYYALEMADTGAVDTIRIGANERFLLEHLDAVRTRSTRTDHTAAPVAVH